MCRHYAEHRPLQPAPRTCTCYGFAFSQPFLTCSRTWLHLTSLLSLTFHNFPGAGSLLTVCLRCTHLMPTLTSPNLTWRASSLYHYSAQKCYFAMGQEHLCKLNGCIAACNACLSQPGGSIRCCCQPSRWEWAGLGPVWNSFERLGNTEPVQRGRYSAKRCFAEP